MRYPEIILIFLVTLLLGLSAPAKDAQRAPDSLPTVETVNGRLEAALLIEEISGWDQLSRDVLYRSAATLDLDRLENKYPQIPKYKLRKLKRLTRGRNASAK